LEVKIAAYWTGKRKELIRTLKGVGFPQMEKKDKIKGVKRETFGKKGEKGTCRVQGYSSHGQGPWR